MLIDSDIKIDNIPVLKWSIIWDSVTNNLIDGSAERFGEFVVIVGRRVSVILYDKVMYCFVYLICCCTHLHSPMPHI